MIERKDDFDHLLVMIEPERTYPIEWLIRFLASTEEGIMAAYSRRCIELEQQLAALREAIKRYDKAMSAPSNCVEAAERFMELKALAESEVGDES